MIFRNSFYWEIEIVSCNVKKKIFEIPFFHVDGDIFHNPCLKNVCVCGHFLSIIAGTEKYL